MIQYAFCLRKDRNALLFAVRARLLLHKLLFWFKINLIDFIIEPSTANVLRSKLFWIPCMIEMNKAVEQEQVPRKKDKKNRKKDKTLEYVIFSLLSVFAASLVTILFWNSNSFGLTDNTIVIGTENPFDQEVASNYSCPFWAITGDGYCDDEANIAECGYDFKDCCQMENDRTLCKDCFCYIQEEQKASLKHEYKTNCNKGDYYSNWGDGHCDLNHNNADHYFDLGDCCLENLSCRRVFSNLGIMDWETSFCPENDPCIKSNLFCIQEELGDGICQDHNNGPFCDYDGGDCCLIPDGEDDDCCECACRPGLDDPLPWLNYVCFGQTCMFESEVSEYLEDLGSDI